MPPTPYCNLYGGPGSAPLRILLQSLDRREKALLPNSVVRTPLRVSPTILPYSHNRALTAKKTCTGGRSARPVDAFMGCFANLQLTFSLLESQEPQPEHQIRPSRWSPAGKRFPKNTLSVLPCLVYYCILTAFFSSVCEPLTLTMWHLHSFHPASVAAPVARVLCSQKR
jgi:hypothetical protein